MRTRLLAGAAIAALTTLVIPGAVFGQGTDAIQRGAVFIAGTQQPDGGFGGFGDGQSFDAIFALRSAGIDPNTVTTGGNSPADFLEAKAAAQDLPAEAAKAALAAIALGLDPADVAGTDLIAVIEDGYDDASGEYGADAFSQGVAILGLVCTGNDVPAKALDTLRASQIDDGGFGFAGTSDPDTAAIALQALLAGGDDATDDEAAAVIAYFKATQASDGGWGFSPTESNASSTAFAVQALIAAGEPIDTAEYEKSGVTPREYLLSQQLEDGSFAGFDPAFAANQVLPALAGRTFCNAPETDIKTTLPTPTATATATASPTTPAPTVTATATATKTVAPMPPNTGSGTSGGQMPLALLVAAAALLGIGSAAAVSARRR